MATLTFDNGKGTESIKAYDIFSGLAAICHDMKFKEGLKLAIGDTL